MSENISLRKKVKELETYIKHQQQCPTCNKQMYREYNRAVTVNEHKKKVTMTWVCRECFKKNKQRKIENDTGIN